MSFKERLSKELEINYEISFEEATKRFPGLTRDNFDLIRYEYRRDVLGIKTKKISKKNKKTPEKEKSNNYTENGLNTKFREQSDKIKTLNAYTTEKLILDMLNNKSSIPESQIRIAVDFMVKIKGNLGDQTNLKIDAKYLKLAKYEEGIDYQPGDMVDVDLDMDEFAKLGREAEDQEIEKPDKTIEVNLE